MGELYTCKDVAARYGVRVITVWDWIRKKKLGAVKIGKEYRVRDEDIRTFELSRMTIQDRGENQ
jgi:excisionase family DNA binding protein